MAKKEVKEEVIKLEKEKEKVSLWDKFMTFCHGVKLESKRIHWTKPSDLVKYSVATLVFVVFFSLFFYAVDALFALLHSII